MDRSNRNFAVVHGPTFFGGCSELVCDSSFAISKVPPGASSKSVMKVGDHALLKKMRPRSMCAALKEMTTDSDNFSLEFLDPNMDNEQKATTLGMHVTCFSAVAIAADTLSLHVVAWNC